MKEMVLSYLLRNCYGDLSCSSKFCYDASQSIQHFLLNVFKFLLFPFIIIIYLGN